MKLTALVLLFQIFNIVSFTSRELKYNQCDNNNEASLILINDTKAKCIDGSQPAFYLKRGYGDGINKWFVFFEGGGWCYTLDDCVSRSKGKLGSSNSYSTCLKTSDMKFYLSNDKHKNPLMYNWNIVLVKYCDGSSYAGDTIIQYKGNTLYFQGKQNRDKTIQTLLLNHRMNQATDIIISGCSAGGLGMFIGIDHIRNIIHTTNQSIPVVGLIDSGIFLDYSSYQKTRFGQTLYVEALNENDVIDYAMNMRQLFYRLNMYVGTNTHCIHKYDNNIISSQSLETENINNRRNHGTNRHHQNRYHSNATFKSATDTIRNSKSHHQYSAAYDKSSCIFAEHLIPHIRTPLFILQPRYDQWQIHHVLGLNFQREIHAFGNNITNIVLNKLLSVHHSSSTVDTTNTNSNSNSNNNDNNKGSFVGSSNSYQLNGAFVDSCAHHCTSCSTTGEDSWNGPRITASADGTAAVASVASASVDSNELSPSVEQIMINPATAFARWYKEIKAKLLSMLTQNDVYHISDHIENKNTFYPKQSTSQQSNNHKSHANGNKKKAHKMGKSRSSTKNRPSLNSTSVVSSDQQKQRKRLLTRSADNSNYRNNDIFSTYLHHDLDRELKTATSLFSMGTVSQAIKTERKHFYMQYGDYPCETCCFCRA